MSNRRKAVLRRREGPYVSWLPPEDCRLETWVEDDDGAVCLVATMPNNAEQVCLELTFDVIEELHRQALEARKARES